MTIWDYHSLYFFRCLLVHCDDRPDTVEYKDAETHRKIAIRLYRRYATRPIVWKWMIGTRRAERGIDTKRSEVYTDALLRPGSIRVKSRVKSSPHQNTKPGWWGEEGEATPLGRWLGLSSQDCRRRYYPKSKRSACHSRIKGDDESSC